MKVAVFGLGEAGSEIARDLASGNCEVIGFDPAPVATPDGVARVDRPNDAVPGVDMVLAVTASADATGALAQSLDVIPKSAVYADLSTSAPSLKCILAETAAAAGLQFVDVALMKPVPGLGLRTPALASGAGAEDFEALMGPMGMPVDAVGTAPGIAATRKLLRSIVIKGLTALMIESMEAANKAGLGVETWENLVDQLDEDLIRRLMTGTAMHSERRYHEMQAAEQLLDDLNVDALMTRGTVESLRRVPDNGLPHVPPRTNEEQSE